MRNLARRLLDLEAANESATDSLGHEAVQVCEKLRTSLIQFAGADGFTALMKRALTLAGADVSSLRNLSVNSDGHIQGIEEAGSATWNLTSEAAIAISAHVLGLLAAFIGEPLTYRVVRQAWPELTLEEL